MAATSKTEMPKARIVVVDDHPMVRGGVIRLLERQSDLLCCGEAGDASEARALIASQKPDLAIIDLRLKGSDSLELIKALKVEFPATRILVLSQYDAPLYVERALRAGALGYVIKVQAPEEIVTAVRTVLAGEIYVTRAMAALLLHRFVGPTPGSTCPGIENLTDRELQVLQLLGAGLSTRKVADELKLSFKTIESHRENIKRKLKLKGAAELVHFANRWAGEQVTLSQSQVARPD
jgi:DNA-binding NarL/FixJ family response regulator